MAELRRLAVARSFAAKAGKAEKDGKGKGEES